jgi:hypothetical protein
MTDTVAMPAYVTMSNFITWLETMPPDQEYDYLDNRNCLFAKFLKSQGHPDPWADSCNFWLSEDGVGNVDGFKLPIGINNIASNKPRTFGDALTRAGKERAAQ